MSKKFEGNLPPQGQKEGYSANFIARVKEVFPNWELMDQALESGSEWVGRYLNDSQGFSMKAENIVKAFEGGNQEKVLEMAKRAEKIDKLYTEWSESRQQ